MKSIQTCYLILLTLTTAKTCTDISQSDFEDGTVRLKQKNKKYCLTEDIVFNPNPLSSATNRRPNKPFDSCFPTDELSFPGCAALSDGPFALGFFAAITIEADDIELDMQGYEVRMSKAFYIQQRSFSIIEIGTAPFVTGRGPANFGTNDGTVSNTYIHDGILGLSSHSGLHSNNAHNVTIENLRISQFETTGIRVNQFMGLQMRNLIIGPSSNLVKPCGYYANAKYLSFAFSKVLTAMANSGIDADERSLTFNGGRMRSVSEIYSDLIESLDIAYRYFMDFESTETNNDTDNALYNVSVSLYSNPMQIPDGASISGIVLNGMDSDSESVQMTNIKITDLSLNVNEIPSVYFDQCSDANSTDRTVVKGPFGAVMDIRRVVGAFVNGQTIDLGDDYTQLSYVGNPLSDAQIALGIIGEELGMGFRTQGLNSEFLKWALESYSGESYETLPECAQFICNGDCMFHSNKGVMGLRMRGIESAVIENIVIKRLLNKSPLASYACANDSVSAHDGGNMDSIESEEGNLGTDVRGISVANGDVIFDGFNNVIEKLVSFNGAVIGFDIRQNAQIEFDYVFKDDLPSFSGDSDTDTEDDMSALQIRQLAPGHEISFGLLAELMTDEKYPKPNNFFACNIKIEDKAVSSMRPYPPNGIDKVWCADFVPDSDGLIEDVLPVLMDTDSDTNPINTVTNVAAKAGINVKQQISEVLRDNGMSVTDKYPNTPYIYFFVGLVCIIMVVFVLVTFIMKCGKMLMGYDRRYKKAYAKASFDDTSDESESDMTDDEENQFNF